MPKNRLLAVPVWNISGSGGWTGGGGNILDDPAKLPEAQIKTISAVQSRGTVSEVHAPMVGETAVLLGAGWRKKGKAIDPAVGILVKVKAGDGVRRCQPLFEVHGCDEGSMADAQRRWSDAR